MVRFALWVGWTALVLGATARLGAQGEILRVKAKAWFPKLDGNVTLDEEPIRGTHVNLEDDLGLGGREQFGEAEIVLLVGTSRLFLSYWSTDFKETETLTRTITFEGETFSVSDNVRTEFQLQGAGLDFVYALATPSIAALQLEVGLGLGAHYLALDGEIRSLGTGQQGADRIGAPLPAVVLYAQTAFAKSYYAELKLDGITGSVGDIHGSFWDGYLEAGYMFWQGLTLSGGYHLLSLNVKNDQGSADQDKLNFELSGPYAGLRWSF